MCEDECFDFSLTNLQMYVNRIFKKFDRFNLLLFFFNEINTKLASNLMQPSSQLTLSLNFHEQYESKIES